MMRNVICWEHKKEDMLEKEMPMTIGEFVKLISKQSLKVARNRGLALGYKFYWSTIIERCNLYRRRSECKYALQLAEKYEPIQYKYNTQNEKVFSFKLNVK